MPHASGLVPCALCLLPIFNPQFEIRNLKSEICNRQALNLLDLTPKSYKKCPTYATKQHPASFIIFTKLLELII